ncbi:tRNA-specific adenosine deaminase subunit tad3 [Coemansia guatemalensis]|uniref:tRNA-specific adenosine deaminase subunit tad3 n=1 Tax=Coemansia guatemalensis TaxID=2761395 RepID=A0A9W8I4W1_9FUNG|nr:tRNA-specific adenosine deaminase subunit tad3 [Coemansia guatemalensis]
MAAERIECGDYLIERIPITEEQQQLVTEDVYTARIEAARTSDILRFASKSLPKLNGIEHVKRVRRESTDPDNELLVILCQCKMIDREELDTLLRGTEWEESRISVNRVPRYPPYTRDQFEQWKALWPVAYRPPVKLKKLAFSTDEKAYIQMCLSEADELRRQNSNTDNRPVAVVIGNANTRNIVAESTDKTRKTGNPLRHAAMCCIAQVAESEVTRLALKEKSTLQKDNKGDLDGENVHLPLKRTHEECDSEKAESSNDVANYLCEGLDVFSSKEPCVMCTMALVHSRIGRLFFIDESESGGISHYSMHCLKALNHHFTAFKCTRFSTSNSQ